MKASQAQVLVVDDEPAIREMIQFALRRAGMDVQGAGGAKEALSSISDNKPDIIILDWMMPGVSGLELTRRLRRVTARSCRSPLTGYRSDRAVA